MTSPPKKLRHASKSFVPNRCWCYYALGKMLFPERSLEGMHTCSKSIAGLVTLYGITAGASLGYAKTGTLAGLDGYMTEAMAHWSLPGMAVEIVKDDQVQYLKGIRLWVHYLTDILEILGYGIQ